MNSERPPKSQLNKEEFLALLKEDKDFAEALAESAALKQDYEERHQFISRQRQYHFWRRLIIPLMVLVPLFLLGVAIWIIVWSGNQGFWTKSVFVSGSFVTLVTFYLALAKGLFSDKAADKSLAERAGDAVQVATNPSNDS